MPPILLIIAVVACERRTVGDAQTPSQTVARVNGNPLYQKDFDLIVPPDLQRVLTASEKKTYLDRWIITQLLYEEALERDMGMTPEIKARLDQYRKDLVADQLVQQVIQDRAIVTEQEVRAYYNEREDQYTRDVRVSHILVNTREDVASVQELLQKRTFSWVATRHSIDKHTGVGGDLGFLSKGNMIPEFEAVVFDMQVGEVSGVIESDFGYHIIKLTDTRNARNKLSFEDVADEISRTLLLEKRAAVYDSLIVTLQARAHVEIVDRELRLALEDEASAASDTTLELE